jgi:hypothetical protein
VVPATFIGGGEYVVALSRYGGTMKANHVKIDAPFGRGWVTRGSTRRRQFPLATAASRSGRRICS